MPNPRQTALPNVLHMTSADADHTPGAPGEPTCDCGYRSRGATLEERVTDARHHARAAHGIDVTAHQVLDETDGTRP